MGHSFGEKINMKKDLETAKVCLKNKGNALYFRGLDGR